MKGFLDEYRNLGFVLLVFALIILAFLMLRPFIPAILWAVVLSVLMMPIHRKFASKRSPNIAATQTTLLTLAIIGVPVILVGIALFFQVNGFVQEVKNATPAGESAFSIDMLMKQLDETFKPLIHGIAPDFSLVAWYDEHKQDLLRTISAPAGQAAVSAGYALFTLVVAFLTMFFMVRDGHRLKEPALELIPLPREHGERILVRVGTTIRAVFVGVVLVAVIQGTVAGVTYWSVGIPHAVLWGVATIILCTIPLLGAPILYIPMGLMLLSQGKYGEAAALLGVGFLVVSQIDNVLRPFIIGARIELHPMAVFFSLLGGIFLMGPVGIMGGPIILTITLAVIDIIRERMKLQQAAQAEAA